MKILYVCTGNICRSPLAEAITRHEAAKRGLTSRMTVASGGTHGYHVGEKPDHRSIAVARSRGVSTEGQLARKVGRDDFETYDLILAMDRGHLMHLTEMADTRYQSKVRLFMAEACGLIEDVPDPYYGHMADFEHVYDMIARGVTALLDQPLAFGVRDAV